MLAGHYGLPASWREVLALISRSTTLSIHHSLLENFSSSSKHMFLSCSLAKDKLRKHQRTIHHSQVETSLE
ncbi:hypothetical protein Q5P01_015676 [Channa striata]|uniref:Uncharacterized protein n=1 Tax=Channa striata TaxID=64152 RepID=A0AA88MF60_CHASR|nr:hypothetical protein Q5P01_015676 [Channa striata]